MCKFGFPGKSTVVYGTVINDHMIACATPTAHVGPRALGVSTVPFRLTFNSAEHDVMSLGDSSMHYSYYSHPKIQDVTPKQAFADQVTLLTVTSAAGYDFNSSKEILF